MTEVTPQITPLRRAEKPALKRQSLISALALRPLGAISIAVLAFYFLASLAAPVIAPYSPIEADFLASLERPSPAHWLGTDSLGRDVLSRILHSGVAALRDVAVAVAVAFVIAVPIALVAALRGGRLESWSGRIADVLISIPGIIVLLIVLALFAQSMVAAMVGLGILAAPGLFRVARSAALAVRGEPYILAARVAGLSTVYIALRHVLPRVSGAVIVNLSFIAAMALITAAGLNFLGLGVTPPAPSLGGLVADAASVMSEQPWLLIPTGGIIAILILALVLTGDAIRDALNVRWAGGDAPRSRRTATGPSADLPEVPALSDPGAILEVDRITVSFPAPGGWQPVVRNVSFSIRPGECVGLMGESGCGKSITGLAVLGLLPKGARLTGGDIRLDGVSMADMSKKDRQAIRGKRVAFVSQEPMVALDPLFTIGFQLGEAIRAHRGGTGADARAVAIELLSLVQIRDPETVLGQYPHEISGGMAQRVSIAIALAGEPDLLIADEPTTALDVTVQAEIVHLLKDIQAQREMAVLIISHDWGALAALCDRAVVMYAGEVAETAAIDRLLDVPSHPYTQGLLASNPRIARVGRPLPTIPGTVPLPRDWPLGCHFQDRCPVATEACAAAPVSLATIDSGHDVRCLAATASAPKVRALKGQAR